jgi:hypothetical protein
MKTKNLAITTAMVGAAMLLANAQAGAVSLVQHGSATVSLPGWSDIDVNPSTDFVYIGAGFGQNGVQGFNFSNPNAPTVVGTTAGPGTGVAVDPATNRFFTIDGGSGGKMREWNGTTLGLVQSSSNNQTGCGGAMALNHSTGIAYGSTQCANSLHSYDPTTNTITNTVSLGMVGSDISLNEATNQVFAVNGGGGGTTKVYNGANLSLITTLSGSVHEANETTNRLYVGSGPNLQVLDGTTYAVLDTLFGENSSYMAVDSVNDWFFTYQGATLKMWDGVTDTLLASLTVGGISSFQMLTTGGDGWLYGLGCTDVNCINKSVTAFEIVAETAATPEPATLALFGAGFAVVALVRRRRAA